MNKSTIKYFSLLLLIVIVGVGISQLEFRFIDKQLEDNPLLIKRSRKEKSKSFIEMQKWQFERLKDPKTNSIPNNIRQKELQFAKNETFQTKQLHKNISSQNWMSEGPVNQGGRTKAIKVDIANENILLAAATTGGVWRSEDDGKSWNSVTDPVFVQNVTDIEQDTRNGKTTTWYYGTGEYYANIWPKGNGLGGLLGNGLYKSNDNGITWIPIQSTISNSPASTMDPFQINWNIELDKSNLEQDEIWVAALGGVYGSLDGGETWAYSIKGTGKIYEIPRFTSVAVTKEGRVYAALSSGNNSGIYVSDDGSEWANITPAFWPSSVERIVIDNAKNNNSILYVIAYTPGVGMAGEEGDYSSLWKYNADTNTWTDLSNNLPEFIQLAGGYTSQTGYDMCLEVSPNDDDFVLLGGTNIYRTTDGFRSKLDDTDWIGGYAIVNDFNSYEGHHPDQHGIFFLTSNPKVVYSAHDGGISKTNNIMEEKVNWNSLNSGYITTQFWSISIEKTIANHPFIIGGLQDNGTLVLSGPEANSEWQFAGSGDGLNTAVSDGAEYFYSSTQFGGVFRLNYSSEWAKVTPEGAEGFHFETRYILDPYNTNVMYLVAGNNVWRNSDLTEIPVFINENTDINWEVFTSASEFGDISTLTATTTKKDLLFVGTYGGVIYKVEDASNINSPFINISDPDFPAGYITAITVDPNNVDNILVSFSNYNILSLFYTTDGGTNWVSVGGNLEENSDGTGNGPSVRDVEILSTSDGNVYFAATSIGLFSTTLLDGENTNWSLEAPYKMGNVIVENIDVRQVDGKIVVGTFGKGVYSNNFITTDISENNNELPTTFQLSQNYPNPFNPATKIKYQIAEQSKVSLKVYDMLGKEVAVLVNKNHTAGVYETSFNAGNLTSGIYFYTLETDNFSETKKMMLIK